ncbi:MAG: hypothetical protein OJF61_002711 [Rhodanobacteraceae bacterium]|nr:MAG: hypothetical protein OJF61_002711 [Rhodanobacteraceae bacterium]
MRDGRFVPGNPPAAAAGSRMHPRAPQARETARMHGPG